MKSMLSAFAVLSAAAAAFAVPQLNKTYWDSNWEAMYFEVDGNKVSAEYIHDKGVITGTLSGDTLRGWWREYNNDQTCGPEGKWSGRVALLWDSTGKAFTGDWVYCADSTSELNLKGDRWVGTWREGGYSESECLAASRYWCDNACRIAPCGESMSEAKCLESGRFWCDGACSLQQCGATSIRRFSRTFPGDQSLGAQSRSGFNVQGRCMEPSAVKSTGFLILGR